jgi:hypothetical protein
MNQATRFFTQKFRLRHSLKYAAFLLLIFTQSSCFQHYYQTNTTTRVDTVMLKQLDTAKKYFIMDTPADAFALTNFSVAGDTVSGNRSEINKKYAKYLNAQAGKSIRFPQRDAEIALSIVHIYTREIREENGGVKIATGQIYRLDINGPDKAADKRSKTISIIGFAAIPVGAAVMAIILAEAFVHSF